jgi:rubredoxin
MSLPSKCPKCGKKFETWFGMGGYSKVGDEQYQCKKCGYIIDLNSPHPHISHEEFD